MCKHVPVGASCNCSARSRSHLLLWQAFPVGGAAAGGGYIEGCWNLFRSSAEAYPGLVVGTGVEDYFDSGHVHPP